MAGTCVFLINSAFNTRASFFTYSNLISFVPLLIFRPYKAWKLSVMEIVNESQFFVTCIVILTSGGQDDYGWKEEIIFNISFVSAIIIQILIAIIIIE